MLNYNTVRMIIFGAVFLVLCVLIEKKEIANTRRARRNSIIVCIGLMLAS